MFAYVDESYGHAGGERFYLLSAVAIDSSSRDEVRVALQDLNSRDAKVHWHDESSARRGELLVFLGGLEAFRAVVVRTAKSERSERQRRLCQVALSDWAQGRAVSTLVFESRSGAEDARDRRANEWLRRSGLSRLRVEHHSGRQEPLLWLPDILCGAMRAHLLGQGTFDDLLAGMAITVRRI